MFKKIICLVLIIELSITCECFVPKFFGYDSAIIVDTDKTQNKYYETQFPTKTRMPPPFPWWRHYPRYHIIPPPPPGQILAINTWAKTGKTTGAFAPITSSYTTTTTTTTTPKSTTLSTSILPPFLREDEFPAELIDIAQNKLGLKSLDEIPTISEFGQLVGTNSPEETLKYIKKLALNERGIALLKAYIESADYTDETGKLVVNNEDLKNEPAIDEDDDMEDIEQPQKDEDLVVVTDEDLNEDSEISYDEDLTQDTSSQTTQELFADNQSSVGPLKQKNSLFSNAKEPNSKEEFSLVDRITEYGKKISKEGENQSKDIQDKQLNTEMKSNILKTPILVRDSIPFNYPIPIRIQSSTTTIQPPISDATVVHLNTAKIEVPHVQHISRITKVPVKQIEDFVASKPKLLDLITKVSRFPISYDRSSPIETQVISAVKKAFEEDDDLKKLLSSAATLK